MFEIARRNSLERAFDMPLEGIVHVLTTSAFHACGGDRAEAEDLVQEAAKRLVQRANAGWRCPATNREGYLFALVRNLHIEEVRSRRRVPVGAIDADSVPGHVPGPEDHVIGRYEAELRRREGLRLLELVTVLRKPEHREIVRLVVLEQLTWAEVSRRLGVPESTLRSRMKSAIRELRSLMRRPGGGGEPA
jgi:RNA polymerase sigma-70 factor (ECF subfamily)